MVITNLIIEFNLDFVHSLKERRNIINSLKEKLKKFNISTLDISSEYPKEATLAIAFLSHNEKQAKEIVDKIEEFIYKNSPELNFEFSFEFI